MIALSWSQSVIATPSMETNVSFSCRPAASAGDGSSLAVQPRSVASALLSTHCWTPCTVGTAVGTPIRPG